MMDVDSLNDVSAPQFCPHCGVSGVLWLHSVDVFVCDGCSRAFLIRCLSEGVDNLRSVSEE